MSAAAGRWRAYLELARVSNVPTVAGNAIAGTLVGTFGRTDVPAADLVRGAAITATACGLMYVAGMALNDFADRRIDAVERPGRPIPSGRVSPEAALAFASTFLLGGLTLLLLVDRAALVAGAALAACIVLYDLVHAATRLSVVLMGACRALAMATAGLAFGLPAAPAPLVVAAALLAAYVASFSVVARREAEVLGGTGRCGACGHPLGPGGGCPECGGAAAPNRLRVRPALARLIGGLPLLAAAVMPSSLLLPKPLTPQAIALVLALLASVAFLLAWTTAAAKWIERTPPRIGAAVTMWIAGISLADATLCLLAGSLVGAAACVACFLVTCWGQRRIAGT